MTWGPIGLGGQDNEVYAQPYAEIAAVVSECPPLDFHAMGKERLVLYLAQHQQVTETIMKRYATLLPVKFGALLENEEGVDNLLRCGHRGLKTALEAMAGKVELELVATWDAQQVFAEIGLEEDVAALKAGIACQPAQRTLPQRVKLGQMVKASLDRRKEEYQRAILDSLASQAADVQVNIFSADSVVANVAFLLDAGGQEVFYMKVHELDARFKSRLNFKVVGPLPPYSFGTVEVKKMDAGEVDRARKLLGLGTEATMREIHTAFRRQARRCHPDVAPEEAEAKERFLEIAAAYEVLTSCCRGQLDLSQGLQEEMRKVRDRRVCSLDPVAVNRVPLVVVRRSGELMT